MNRNDQTALQVMRDTIHTRAALKQAEIEYEKVRGLYRDGDSRIELPRGRVRRLSEQYDLMMDLLHQWAKGEDILVAKLSGGAA